MDIGVSVNQAIQTLPIPLPIPTDIYSPLPLKLTLTITHLPIRSDAYVLHSFMCTWIYSKFEI